MFRLSATPVITVMLCILCLTAGNGSLYTAMASGHSPVMPDVYPAETTIENELRERLRIRIEAQPLDKGALEVDGKVLYSQRVLPQFYVANGFQPLWVTQDGKRVEELLTELRSSTFHGLNPQSYHMDQLSTIMSAYATPKEMSTRQQVDLELLLTDALILMTSHLVAGQLDPITLDPNWHVVRDEVDYEHLLNQLLAGEPVNRIIRQAQPNHRRYTYLMDALARYRDIANSGGWPAMEEGPTLRPGDDSNRITRLRERLYLAGDYQPFANGTDAANDLAASLLSTLYDEELEKSVIRFQRRHGLDADGVIGRMTLAALNTPVEKRIGQVLVNLERWRWLRRDLGEKHVLVNIANFSVEVVERGETVKEMRAIVGRQYRQTPVFSAPMTYLVLSPFWNLPPGIIRNDIIPRLRNSTDYVRTQNIKIFDGWGANAQEVNPDNVNWHEANIAGRYRFRQEPGPSNALGDVKFMFPNRFHVYLHDTPSRDMFSRTVRDFSSGCIRIERPLEFAEYLLKGDSRWNRAAIDDAVRQRKERTVTLREPVWVHILYWTAWAEADGTIHFRDDIYQRDARLLEVIQQKIETSLTSM